MRKLPIFLAMVLLWTIRASAQFTSVTPLTPLQVTTDSNGKPQSKVWNYGGFYWSIFPNSTGMHVWRLDGTTWTDVFKISSSTVGKADCKVVGDITHIFLCKGATASQLVSLEYVPALKTYKLWTKRPKIVGISLDPGIETGTIDIDGNGRMWLASNGNNNVYVRWSDSPYGTWSTPISICPGINSDDICGVIYLPLSQQIAVMWSNENAKRFGFKTHTDGVSPTTWSEDEVPATQSGVNVGGGMADDHMNLALASDGTLYCAVKTSYNKSAYPELGLLIRRPNGAWDNLYEVDHKGTRPIVMLNENVGKLKIIYTTQDGGGDIVYKESPLSNISLSTKIPLISGFYNNCTSMKINYSTDLVILASDTSTVVGVLASDAPLNFIRSAAVSKPPLNNGEDTNTEPATALAGLPPEELAAYPNPFSAYTTIKFKVPVGNKYSVSLHTKDGSQVALLRQGESSTSNTMKVEVNGNKLPPGLYLVKLQTNKGVKTLRLMVNK